MNEEEKQQIFLDTTAYIITCVTAPGVSGVSDVGEGLKHINNLLKVVTAQQAEIAALKAEDESQVALCENAANVVGKYRQENEQLRAENEALKEENQRWRFRDYPLNRELPG